MNEPKAVRGYVNLREMMNDECFWVEKEGSADMDLRPTPVLFFTPDELEAMVRGAFEDATKRVVGDGGDADKLIDIYWRNSKSKQSLDRVKGDTNENNV